VTETTRVYRVEHVKDRIGPFCYDDLRIPDCLTTHAAARDHLRSMPTTNIDFGIDSWSFSPRYIFAFPTMKRMRYWITYKYRKAMVDAGFVVGVYDVRRIYMQSEDQVMYTRRVSEHVRDISLVKGRRCING